MIFYLKISNVVIHRCSYTTIVDQAKRLITFFVMMEHENMIPYDFPENLWHIGRGGGVKLRICNSLAEFKSINLIVDIFTFHLIPVLHSSTGYLGLHNRINTNSSVYFSLGKHLIDETFRWLSNYDSPPIKKKIQMWW